MSVGESTDQLEKMGKGPSLADQPAIQRLAKHADQRIVSLGYLSNSLRKASGSAKQTMDDIVGSVEEALVQAKVDEEDRKVIIDDVRAFDLAKYLPEPGEVSGVAYLTGRGYEMFQYNAGKRPMMDSSKPLSILNHVALAPP